MYMYAGTMEVRGAGWIPGTGIRECCEPRNVNARN